MNTAPTYNLPIFYLTGTDTHVGKTQVSCALLHLAGESGLRTVGLKPIASGCDHDGEHWRNEDVEKLAKASNQSLRLDEINRYLIIEPIAPHLGARQQRLVIDANQIEQMAMAWRGRADFIVLEGVGGWAAPLSDELTQAELARRLDAPVIMVVGLRLGCINHALLCARAIAADGLKLAGWIGTQLDPRMRAIDGNIDTLRTHIKAPCLGIIPYQTELNTARMASYLELP